MMIIAYIYLPLGILYSAAVVATFMRAAAATVAPNVASTGLNDRNLWGQMILWYLGYSGYDVVSCL